jgi:hypothetical protein
MPYREHEKTWGSCELCCHRGSLPATLIFYYVTGVPTGKFILQFVIQDSGPGL